jgi:hypothetical protein
VKALKKPAGSVALSIPRDAPLVAGASAATFESCSCGLKATALAARLRPTRFLATAVFLAVARFPGAVVRLRLTAFLATAFFLDERARALFLATRPPVFRFVRAVFATVTS